MCGCHDVDRYGASTMTDVIFIGAGVGFFIVAIAYTYLCDHI